MIDVVMPQMGESIVEGTLTRWLKKPGDKVERDEPLFEISTDKVDTEIPSPAAGTLAETLFEAGAVIGINTVRPGGRGSQPGRVGTHWSSARGNPGSRPGSGSRCSASTSSPAAARSGTGGGTGGS